MCVIYNAISISVTPYVGRARAVVPGGGLAVPAGRRDLAPHVGHRALTVAALANGAGLRGPAAS